jgi:hypothetical protein
MAEVTPVDPAALPLRDIHLPEPVSWWPPAPGVWLLLALLALLLAAVIVWLAVRQRRLRIRRQARSGLKALRRSWCADPQPVEQAAALSELLRRIGLSYFGRGGFGGRLGREEIACLNRLVDDERRRLPVELGDWLLEAPYRRPQDVGADELDRWLTVVEDWVDALPPFEGIRSGGCGG